MSESYFFPSVTYPSPLAGYENAEPLPDEKNEDGKSYKNPQTGVLSPAYDKFVEPLDNGRRGGLYEAPLSSFLSLFFSSEQKKTDRQTDRTSC